MTNIKIHKCYPKNPVLKKIIKLFWIIRSYDEKIIHGKLIPTNNIDLIINNTNTIEYKTSKKEESFANTHFSGIQNHYRFIEQKGPLDIVGISFHPTGLYPLVKIPVIEFRNHITSIDSIIPGIETKIERVAEVDSISHKISIIEEALMSIIDPGLLPGKNFDLLMNDFIGFADCINIKNFCKKNGVNQKSLERFFNKYIGTTPKAFANTTKLQKAIKLLHMRRFESLTELGYELNYYDQTHFINSFKSFVGKTPSKQLRENDLIFDLINTR